MDPWLEARWSNVHTTLVAAIQEALQPQLPRGLRARAEERVLLETTADASPRAYRSDVAVVEAHKAGEVRDSGGDAEAADAVVIDFHEQEVVVRWVQVIDTADGNRVVTAVEVLSAANKAPGPGNVAYLLELDDYRRGSVSLVEIDLLRYPTRARLPLRTEDLPADRRTPYLACVRRAWTPSRWLAWPIALRERLPRIPVPLRPVDAAVWLDLQALLERAYVAGGHDDIDYGRPCEPPLAPEDAEWARALVARGPGRS
jgi:hypothetical protein